VCAFATQVCVFKACACLKRVRVSVCACQCVDIKMNTASWWENIRLAICRLWHQETHYEIWSRGAPGPPAHFLSVSSVELKHQPSNVIREVNTGVLICGGDEHYTLYNPTRSRGDTTSDLSRCLCQTHHPHSRLNVYIYIYIYNSALPSTVSGCFPWLKKNGAFWKPFPKRMNQNLRIVYCNVKTQMKMRVRPTKTVFLHLVTKVGTWPDSETKLSHLDSLTKCQQDNSDGVVNVPTVRSSNSGTTGSVQPMELRRAVTWPMLARGSTLTTCHDEQHRSSIRHANFKLHSSLFSVILKINSIIEKSQTHKNKPTICHSETMSGTHL